jgi:hypothetical protein
MASKVLNIQSLGLMIVLGDRKRFWRLRLMGLSMLTIFIRTHSSI